LFDYLAHEGEQELDIALALIAQKTRNYAKRQETFFKSLQKKLPPDASIQSINLTFSSVDLYLKQLSQYIMQNRGRNARL
jgi:tRNA A37 N6-isopentenylltransferase MiaA